MRIYCEKCGSEDIEITTYISAGQPERRTSIDKVCSEDFSVTTLLFSKETKLVKCRKCGNEVKL
jgi:ribosomal protein S27E